jgi:hypothetical protein
MSERMQSLLSRAVEDQQSEQRSLAGALDDVRAQLAALSRDVQASREHPTDAHDASAVAALTVELRESTRRSADRLDNVARMVAQRGEDLVTLQNAVTALSEQVRAQGESVAGLAGTVDGVGQHVSSVATYLGDRGRDDSSRIVSLEQRLMTLQNDMTAVGSHVAGLTEAAAASSGDGLDARIRSIVAGALVGTERRLATHIEDSVMALAEAMLRRRATGGQPEAVHPPAPQPPDAPAPVTAPEAAPTDAAPADAAPTESAPTEVAPTASAQTADSQPPLAPEPAVAQPLTDPLPTVTQPIAEPFETAALPDGPPVQAPAEQLPPGQAATASADQTVDLTDGYVATRSAANGGSADAAATTNHVNNGASPKVPAAWTTVMPDDDQRRRGWFRSRD